MGIQISAIGFAIVVMLAIAVFGPTRIFAQIPSFEEPFPEPVPGDGGIIFPQPFPPDREVPFPLPLQFPIPDSTLLRELNSQDAYIIYGNAKFFIANPAVFSAVGFSVYEIFIGTKNNVYFHTPKVQHNQKIHRCTSSSSPSNIYLS